MAAIGSGIAGSCALAASTSSRPPGPPGRPRRADPVGVKASDFLGGGPNAADGKLLDVRRGVAAHLRANDGTALSGDISELDGNVDDLLEARVALPVTNPWQHFGQYAVELSDADAERVGTTEPAAIDVWVTVRAAAEPKDFSCNLRAPIVIWNGRGHQVINEAEDAPVRAAHFTGATESVQAA